MSTPNIRQDPSGRWSVIIEGTPGADGRRRQIRRRGFRTKGEAKAALSLMRGDRQRGVFIAPDKVTLGSFLVHEWLPAKAGSLRPSTLSSYEGLVRNYVLPHLGGVRLQGVDAGMLNRLYADLLSTGRTQARRGLGAGLSPKTVRNVHGMLAKAFSDALRWGRLQRNPADAADQPKGGSPEMRCWTADQLRTFITSVSEHRWSGIWALMATTGMRRGEVLGLRWTDVDLDAGTLTIRSTRIRYGSVTSTSTPKTQAGNRTISVGPVVVAALRSWRAVQAQDQLLMGAGWLNQAGLVVTLANGSPINPEAYSNLFVKLVRRASLPMIRLHDLRHSYATSALASGVPIKVLSQRLGHADITVTLKIYAHVLAGDDQAAAALADGLLAPAVTKA
jgi:integrase